MTFPTFEGGIPEMPVEMPQEAAAPDGGSTPVRMHSPELQTIRLLADTIFTFIKAPQFQHKRLQVPAQRMQHHAVVSQLMGKFNPSHVQLAVLSQQNQPPLKVEKPAVVSPPKESGNQRDETTAKAGGKELVSIEVFAGEKSQSSRQQNSSGQQGGNKPSAENKPSPSSASGETGASPEAKSEAPAGESTEQPIPQPFSPGEKSVPTTDKKPSEAPPAATAPEPKAIETPPFLAPMTEKAAELPVPLPIAKVDKNVAPVQSSVANPSASDKNAERPVAPVANNASELPVETLSPRQEPVVADSPANLTDQGSAKLPSEAPKVEGKEAGEAKDAGTRSRIAEKTMDSEAGQPQQPLSPSKTEPSNPGQVAANKMAAKEASEKIAPPSTEREPEKKDSTESSVKPVHQKKEPDPIDLNKDKPAVEEALKHKQKEILHPPIAMDPHIARRLPEDAGQSTQLKVFQVMDRNANVQIPPWLAQLLPDLNKAEAAQVKGGGGKSGAVIQNPYKLSDMLFILLCAHLAGAKSLLEVIRFMEVREKWLAVALGLRHGLPPRQLFFWFLVAIDAHQFDHTVRRWLSEIRGRQEKQALLLEVMLTQTPLGFIIGQQRHPDVKWDRRRPVEFVNGFLLENCTVMARSERPYGALLSRIDQRGGKYIAEVEDELIPAEEYDLIESYIEGQEKIVAIEWMAEEPSEMHLKVLSEIFDPRGVVQTERFYISNLKNPADYYFDLSRLQRPSENKFAWLLNIALSLPSIDVSIQRCNASLGKFQTYAAEVIAEGEGALSIDEHMQKALRDNAFLLELMRL